MNPVNPSIFKAYDIRGIYPSEINPEAAYLVALAFGKYLKDDLKLKPPIRVGLGQDMRGSSAFLAKEVVRGLNNQDIDVVDLGRVPTPAFYYAVAFKDLSGGMMVTASHQPKEYNGLKLCVQKAVPVAIGFGLEKIKASALAEDFSKLRGRGKFESINNVTAEYVRQELSYLNAAKIKKFKIAADPGNAMGAIYLDEFFKPVPSEPIKINWDLNGNMPIHEANPLKIDTLQQLREIIRNETADIGIATDGDGDRIAFLDDLARIIPGDLIIAIVSQELLKKYPGGKIIYDLRCSRAVKEAISQAGGVAIPSRVGHSFIKTLMREKDALFAGEFSGHYYFRENFNFESPVFVLAQLLLRMSESDEKLSTIWEKYKKYSHTGEINFEVSDKQKIINKLETAYSNGKITKIDGVRIDYDDWWFLLRPSANDPVIRLNLEARDDLTMKQKLEEISTIIKSG